MIFPENPEKRPSLWDSVAMQLAQKPMCLVIAEGVGNPTVEAVMLGRDLVELTMARLRKTHICRIGANRGMAVSPHFAGTREGQTVSLTEFLSQPSEGTLMVKSEALKRDLETAVINLLFADSEVNMVFVPLCLALWTMKDAEVISTPTGLVFKKRAQDIVE